MLNFIIFKLFDQIMNILWNLMIDDQKSISNIHTSFPTIPILRPQILHQKIMHLMKHIQFLFQIKHKSQNSIQKIILNLRVINLVVKYGHYFLLKAWNHTRIDYFNELLEYFRHLCMISKYVYYQAHKRIQILNVLDPV